ncbi:hypothetical protein N7491_003380 [Penicillium cf. griseofulvum]|uniref:Ferric oxidoreductase domain-containing protein n=1 Tax=Penicillium cf. griseofulvum TaxID=2972120 RepID=A0A9W9T1H7_9EURO|nr:hypothetical protein N7472_002446 [Penicillium cf. griseofulvum]KAJ5440974.1 hypothetical protein N7491_003380 [Penicillium cf. griseofulvum]KAJ5449019.1 hypothetical protein N7445_003840 [Penicillium cf. griseofulvum]
MGTGDMEDMDMGDMGTSWVIEESPDAHCYAENDAFLQTLAYCIYVHCPTEANSTLQRYWEMNVAGSHAVQPSPKESYQQALWSIGFKPNVTVNSTETLKSASLIPDAAYALEYNTLSTFERVETSHETYGLVLILTSAIIPIALSVIRFIPFPARWAAKVQAQFLHPPLIGNRHNEPFFNTFIMPTRGQALFVAYLIIINIILCAVGYESTHLSSWYGSETIEITTYVSNRAGVLSFANIPVLFLYSGRNNVLLWLTNWSHSTFLLLHRWVAVICTIQACLHSAIYLQIYTANGTLSSESKLPYWCWGIIATLAMVVLLPGSALQIRRRCYELFLAWHIFFSLLALIGCYLHIFYRYAHQWGYENWIYIAFGIWAFERGFRVLRIIRNGILQAHISVVDDEYIKLEIPDTTAVGHVYLYFPTLTWRIWENHPFSVMADVQQNGSRTFKKSRDCLLEGKDENTKIHITATGDVSGSEILHASRQDSLQGHSRLLIYIRTGAGITRHLRGQSQLHVLVESAYHPTSILGKEVTHGPNIIAIAGGVGVTAIMPILLGHRGYHKLLWAVRSKALVDSVQESLGEARFKHCNAVTFHNQRMDVSQLLEDEVARFTGGKLTVAVSGPPRMADEVRVVVARLIKSNPAVTLTFVEESFSW